MMMRSLTPQQQQQIKSLAPNQQHALLQRILALQSGLHQQEQQRAEQQGQQQEKREQQQMPLPAEQRGLQQQQQQQQQEEQQPGMQPQLAADQAQGLNRVSSGQNQAAQEQPSLSTGPAMTALQLPSTPGRGQLQSEPAHSQASLPQQAAAPAAAQLIPQAGAASQPGSVQSQDQGSPSSGGAACLSRARAAAS